MFSDRTSHIGITTKPPIGHMDKLTLALSHHKAGRYQAALPLYAAILESDPDNVNALALLGTLQNALSNFEVGISLIQRAIHLCPQMTEAYYNLGNALIKINRVAEAIAAYDAATELSHSHVNAWLNKGDAYRSMRKMEMAEHCYRQALSSDPSNRHLYVRLGVVLRFQSKLAEAGQAYLRALELDPSAADANYNLANILFDGRQFDEALKFYRRSMFAQTPNPMAAGMMLSCMTKTCGWEHELMRLGGLAALHGQLAHPITVLQLSDANTEQQTYARAYARYIGLVAKEPRKARPQIPDQKLRIGYLSADFHNHATAYLIAELFEVHDRSRFEIVGLSYGPDDQSTTRQRLIRSFDKFIDFSDVDDATAAESIANAGIDILVDLKGHTQDARAGILTHRPAPVIVNYLGYPGTMGSEVIDYILADSTTLPFADQSYYDEQIVHLPNCYQVNDSALTPSLVRKTREQHDLPEGAFVFCCLNGSQKITWIVFAAWMRVLAAVPHGVLWLYHDNDTAVLNLRRAAAAHGIDPDRLVFARSLPHEEHLARYRHVDLFLDTTPYNAHTTASDALRSHVPIVTVKGATFASRVAASLLKAVNVPELVTANLSAYEDIARKLASDPDAMAAIRRRIAEGVRSGPLFDTSTFARGLEAAYTHMHGRAVAGYAPAGFAVAADNTISQASSDGCH